jgi:hypothetical protein
MCVKGAAEAPPRPFLKSDLAMESSDFHESRPPTISSLGQKVNITLETMVGALHDLSDKVQDLTDKVDNVRIDNAKIDGTLLALKESTERTTIKVESLDDKVNDLKQNLTALGVKANTNILFQGLGILTLAFGLFGIFNLLNTVINSDRSSTQSPSAVTAPSPVPARPLRSP